MPFIKDKLSIELEETELAAVNTFGGFSPAVKKTLIVLGIAIIPAYFIAEKISEKYWLNKFSQNAFSAKPSFTNPQLPEISKVTLIQESGGYISAFVQVINQNLDLSANDVTYKFNFYNSENQIVYTHSDKLFLLPNESKYLTVPRFLPISKIDSADFQVADKIAWQKRLFIPKVNLIASKPNAFEQSEPASFVLEGKVTNSSPYNLNQARITFLLYGPSGQVVRVTQRDEFSIKPGEARAYKQLWPDLTTFNISRFDVKAQTNLLDPSNLTAPSPFQTSPQPSSDLSRPTGNDRN